MSKPRSSLTGKRWKKLKPKVDVTPRWEPAGVQRIQAFMTAHPDGFDSYEHAASEIAGYLPHRRERKTPAQLAHLLHAQPDGRLRWHWDPRFLDGRRRVGPVGGEVERILIDAARRVTIPALLVRGASSELVQEAHAKEFLELVPHASYVDVSGARHMVAGDRNDQFANAIRDFLKGLKEKL